MDTELYVSELIDGLGWNLSYRQKNFLQDLFVKAFMNGHDLAHNIVNKGAFESQAIPFLLKRLDPLIDQPEVLEALSLGYWDDHINVGGMLHDLRDRFFSRNSEYTHREDIQLHDLSDYEDKIMANAITLTEKGLMGIVKDWCLHKVMKLADKELHKETTPALKTKLQPVLVDHSGEAVSTGASAVLDALAELVEAGDVIDFRKAKDKIKKDNSNMDLEKKIKEWSGSNQIFKNTNKNSQWVLRSPKNDVWVVMVDLADEPAVKKAAKQTDYYQDIKTLEEAYKEAMEEGGLKKLYFPYVSEKLAKTN